MLRELIQIVIQDEPINWQKVNETITRILRVWCSDVDRLGGVSEQFEFDDNVTSICYVRCVTLLAYFSGESVT